MKTFYQKDGSWFFGKFKLDVELTSFYDYSDGELKANFTSPYDKLEYRVIDVITHDNLYKETWNSQSTDSIYPVIVSKTTTGLIFISWILIEWNVDTDEITECYDINTVVMKEPCSYQSGRAEVNSRDSPLRSKATVYLSFMKNDNIATLTFPYVWWNPSCVDYDNICWL